MARRKERVARRKERVARRKERVARRLTPTTVGPARAVVCALSIKVALAQALVLAALVAPAPAARRACGTLLPCPLVPALPAPVARRVPCRVALAVSQRGSLVPSSRHKLWSQSAPANVPVAASGSVSEPELACPPVPWPVPSGQAGSCSCSSCGCGYGAPWPSELASPSPAPALAPAAPVVAPCRAGTVLLPRPLAPALPAPVARWMAPAGAAPWP